MVEKRGVDTDKVRGIVSTRFRKGLDSILVGEDESPLVHWFGIRDGFSSTKGPLTWKFLLF